VTAALKPGANFVIATVDNTRHEDGVPTTQTDWFNYGGLTREVSLITVPEAFIDQYDLHLSKTEPGVIEGWVHVQNPRGGNVRSRWRFRNWMHESGQFFSTAMDGPQFASQLPV
jgi:hypothetical protein